MTEKAKKKTAVKKKVPKIEENDLIKEVDELTDEIKKRNSRLRIFWGGIIDGLGKAIGATIGFAILIALLSFIVARSSAPWVSDVIEWLNLDDLLNT